MLIQELEQWYLQHQRNLPFRSQPNPYWIWVSEIMLQQTQMDTVIPYFEKFIRRFPTLQDIASCSEENLLAVVQGLGYYRRFRLMKKAAEKIVSEFNGVFPKRFEEIEQLPGVGEYTAGAIASIAYNLPHSAVDGNVIRVISRFQGIQDDTTLVKTRRKIQQLNQSWIEQATPRIYTQALMELGALVCRPTQPRCHECPIKSQCVAFQEQKTHQIPFAIKKKRQQIENLFTIIFYKQGHVGLVKRKEGLLEGMYLFPQWEEDKLEDVFSILQLKKPIYQEWGFISHVFTHKRWDMKVFSVDVHHNPIPDIQWFTFDDLPKIPIAKAHQKVLHLYMNSLQK